MRVPVRKPSLQVECPECGQVVPVPLVLLIGEHAWTHTSKEADQ